ncbi:MAG: sigma 54-interacting transcriptional regulator [Desulfobacula sp.]|jgi:transcriptional regulator with GAF, ATPase, and Fis domain|uniref:sigma-54-dependent Fis family transcriptional regulator n=2 Tax=Desulfobacula sp. TaxID=2593537 RepID=UPI001ECC485E|nr:sigma 54-interacting transcriptional regulator [Desulfobacula sp.]MBT6611845.1 sigma 54-interacting transcriptional regulator [Deltaproteobacteria bacterium]MBT3807504.1 sigma 54-interacting transcriptional regulator [Desulfobacula sp.]MBT4874984.1 sigma 54-interacting transcriptional regulator [Desulfobacula sp.]MBT5546585.1 sigma 54-interacting transcriptional regulator [Desulfobacula sp.]
MQWNLATRHQMLLEITNAVISKTSNQEFLNALAAVVKKYFPCDRLSINLYDKKGQSLKYFTNAAGIDPKGISSLDRRPLLKGTIAKMAIQSRQPVIIDDLSQYKDMFSIGQMVKAGLISTLAFPLVMRNIVFGSLHFSFKKTPENLSELSELLTEVSKQVAIAVDNLVAYNRLKNEKQNLEREKRYLIGDSEDYKSKDFCYTSPQMTEVMRVVKRVAEIDAPVFITGETGTGKDFLARYIHHISPRKDYMFVKVNCPAIPPTLFESELFGHAKGAFTGADSMRVGRFEMADMGTIFLDEVGELPENQQVKLLQVLQESRFERVGDSRPIEVDFRLIAATNRDPVKSIQEGKLRNDLYYRLNIIQIHVPPLRERVGDIPLLIEQVTLNESDQIHQPAPRYAQQALQLLNAYHWPGNVRELKNFVKRMIILKPGGLINSHDIEKMIEFEEQTNVEKNIPIPTLAESERIFIEQALIKCRGIIGGKNGAARLLDVPRSTLQYRMKKYGIKPEITVQMGD